MNKTTVEPCITNTLLIQESYYGEFSLSVGKALTISLHSTRLMRTTDSSFLPNEQIFVESQPRLSRHCINC